MNPYNTESVESEMLHYTNSLCVRFVSAVELLDCFLYCALWISHFQKWRVLTLL